MLMCPLGNGPVECAMNAERLRAFDAGSSIRAGVGRDRPRDGVRGWRLNGHGCQCDILGLATWLEARSGEAGSARARRRNGAGARERLGL